MFLKQTTQKYIEGWVLKEENLHSNKFSQTLFLILTGSKLKFLKLKQNKPALTKLSHEDFGQYNRVWNVNSYQSNHYGIWYNQWN